MREMEYICNREITACFTGHRMILPADIESVRERVSEAVARAYADGYRTFICGGARGFDTLAALEVIRLRRYTPDIRLVLAIPCASQAERWLREDREKYRSVMAEADETVILSESYYNGCMQNRNRFMVDHSSLCLCYLLRFEGGTWSTVRYALHQGVALKNLAMNQHRNDVMRESIWNSTYIFPSAQKNANIVRLYRFPLPRGKWINISKRLFMKRK